MLAVEPLALPFENLVPTYAAFDNVKCEKLAFQPIPTRRPFMFDGDNQLMQMSSFSRDVIMKHRHLVPDLKNRIREIEVPCMTFGQLLKKHNLEHVDLLWIDTEGFDYHVIKMCMEANVLPTIIGFESVHLHHREKKECGKLLASKRLWLAFFREGYDCLSGFQGTGRPSRV